MRSSITVCSPQEARMAVKAVLEFGDEVRPLDSFDKYNIRLILSELLANSLLYTGVSRAVLHFEWKEGRLKGCIRDFGKGFDWRNTACPTIENEHGRGVYLVKETAETLRYNKKGNAVLFTYVLQK